MAATGENPGKGKYECTKCYSEVELDDTTNKLPTCPRCNGTSFIKVG